LPRETAAAAAVAQGITGLAPPCCSCFDYRFIIAVFQISGLSGVAIAVDGVAVGAVAHSGDRHGMTFLLQRSHGASPPRAAPTSVPRALNTIEYPGAAATIGGCRPGNATTLRVGPGQRPGGAGSPACARGTPGSQEAGACVRVLAAGVLGMLALLWRLQTRLEYAADDPPNIDACHRMEQAGPPPARPRGVRQLTFREAPCDGQRPGRRSRPNTA
jgi:hypothetical protein